MNATTETSNGKQPDPGQTKKQTRPRLPNPRFKLTPAEIADIRRSPPVLMTVNECGAFLSASPRSVWNWIKEGDIKARRIGGRVLIRLKDINALLA